MTDSITIAIPKGRILHDSVALFRKIGIDCDELLSDTRKLIFENPKQKMRYMIVRATDVPTYVEYGCADLGIVGRDTLLEQQMDLYEPLDLKFGYCRLVVAEPVELSRTDDPASWTNIRIATKYPNVTEKYFAGKGVQEEIVKLYGSIELAPVAKKERLLPLGLAKGCVLTADVPKDTVLTYDMVRMPKETVLLQLRRVQDQLYS